MPGAPAQCSVAEIRDAQSSGAFGSSVAIWGDLAAVGSPLHEVDGIDSGAAFVYRRDPATGGWNLEAVLTAGEGQSGDFFGGVSASGETVIVGAPRDDDLGADSGSAYVFRREGGVWLQEQKLLPDDGAAQDGFGRTAVWGDVVAIGAPFDDDHGRESGSVYVFRRDSSGWVQEQKITPEDGLEDDWFGHEIALEGDLLLVGALRHDEFSGAAYLYRYDAAAARWALAQKLVAPDPRPTDFYGSAVSLQGDRLVIGAMGDTEGGVVNSGAALVYHYDGDAGEWVLGQKLLPSGRHEESQYGSSVAISGDFALVAMSSHGGYTGPPALFRLGALGWEEIGELGDIFPPDDSNMGIPVRMWSDRAIVGSRGWLDGNAQPGVATVFSLHACACLADFDGNGSVTTRDVIAFLNAWARGHPGADAHADRRIDSRDIVVFLNAWVDGC